MASKLPETVPSSNDVTPSLSNDLKSVFLASLVTIAIWVILGILSTYVIDIFGFLFGLVIIVIALYFFILPFTGFVIGRWLEILAYNMASRRTGVSYMNYPKKCPFLRRNRFTFSCVAEQLAPFEVSIFEKCHKELMWEACWPERIPSILEVYDYSPEINKQQFAIILATMKEHASPASMKMYETLTNEDLDIKTRVWAGQALAEMKDESGIETLITMVGHYDQPFGRLSPKSFKIITVDQKIQNILATYGEIALPYLNNVLQDCDRDLRCGSFIEVIGKIGHASSIPTLESLLTNDSTGDYTKLQTIYALQGIGSEEAFKIIIEYLEEASEEDQLTIKQVCLSRGLISFPLLIEMLSRPEISEDYYTRIGDILADVDAKTYDLFFTKVSETQGAETVQRLATILKENTPEEEEFLKVHQVIDKHLMFSHSSTNPSN